MAGCISGKSIFQSKELAEEALIQNHIRNNHREGSGPINVYECRDCLNWHFTSNGNVSPLLLDSEIKKRIAKERTALEWEYRFK
jgi:hypothetical protein